MKYKIEQLVRAALAALPAEFGATVDAVVEIERTRDVAHGDFATNAALKLSKAAKRNPRQLAQALIDALPKSDFVARVEIAGPGFINFHLSRDAYARELEQVLDLGDKYGRGTAGNGQRVLVEFVSANPTGPLHVGHGRHAAYGASLCNLLEAAGFGVHREYYINDAGRQMDIFATSVWLRYLESCGETLDFPSNGYRGDYVRTIGDELFAKQQRRLHFPLAQVFANIPGDAPEGDGDKYIDAVIARAKELLGANFEVVFEQALVGMLAIIRQDLADFGVQFNQWYSERSLFTDGQVDRAMEILRERGQLYQKEGAWWFRTTDYGDEKDRVVVRENGQKTYFASDIAYHANKYSRHFDHYINVWGADHHGYISRVKGGIAAMGGDANRFEVQLMQLVALYKGGVQVSMGKRSGDFVTLRELREEVGNDACRFFYVLRSNDQSLDFDLELAKSTSNDNPVYYIQYAHARVASVMRQLGEKGFTFDAALGRASLDKLQEPHEQSLLTAISRYPEMIEQAAINRAPHALAHYLRELANEFHTYYNAHQFIVDDAGLRNARLTLVRGLQQVIRNGLALLGVAAPDTM